MSLLGKTERNMEEEEEEEEEEERMARGEERDRSPQHINVSKLHANLVMSMYTDLS